LLETLGARFHREPVNAPDPTSAEIAEFAQGSIVLLAGSRQALRGRRIAGMTVAVRDLDAAARFAGAGARRSGASVFVDPRRALGYWLEFRR
jgi:hypothetical protein